VEATKTTRPALTAAWLAALHVMTIGATVPRHEHSISCSVQLPLSRATSIATIHCGWRSAAHVVGRASFSIKHSPVNVR